MGSPALAWKAPQGRQGAAGCGEVEGEDKGMQALGQREGRVPCRHGSGRAVYREACTCSETILSYIVQRGSYQGWGGVSQSEQAATQSKKNKPFDSPSCPSSGRAFGGLHSMEDAGGSWCPIFLRPPFRAKQIPRPDLGIQPAHLHLWACSPDHQVQASALLKIKKVSGLWKMRTMTLRNAGGSRFQVGINFLKCPFGHCHLWA